MAFGFVVVLHVCVDDVFDGLLMIFAFGFLVLSANVGLDCVFYLIGVHICCWEMVQETRILCLVHLLFTILGFFINILHILAFVAFFFDDFAPILCFLV